MKGPLLIVEDDEIMGESLVDRFQLEGYEVAWCKRAEEALERLRTTPFGLILSDLRLPGMDGRALLRELRRLMAIAPPFILITGHGSVTDAVAALHEGATDYITKPFDLNKLVEKVEALCLNTQNGAASACLGVSPAMRQIDMMLPRIAAQASTILLTGESGVGKECVARRLHELGSRSEGAPFIALNCAAMPAELLEAELFGYEKGAFTGATRSKPGLFEAASGGTLFLDEIGELALSLQAKLLRAVQEREVMRLGAQSVMKFDARLIFATNRDLRAEVEQGRFREDLYYRINVIHLRIPPLRERPEDIPWLAQGFINEFARRTPGEHRALTPDALEGLSRYPWPGNVRELRHAIERACILSTHPLISTSDLMEPTATMTSASPARPSTPQTGAGYDLTAYLQSCEREFILDTLRAHEGKVMTTAKALGISRKSLWDKMRRLGLKNNEPDAD
ncbi:MAG TPA: sigma-54 dependent transcriptional regulator [Thauera sp.]|nr:sigma-54 dependent transcriptional regulator [Thauera sp.]